MIAELCQIFSEREIDICAIEGFPGEIFVKFISNGQFSLTELQNDLRKMPDVYTIGEIELLPQEKRERLLQAILQSESDGILAIDNDGVVRIINTAAKDLFHKDTNQIIDHNISELLLNSKPLENMLRSGNTYNDQELLFDTNRGRAHCLASGYPIKSEFQKTAGAVIRLKSAKASRPITRSRTRSQEDSFKDIIYCTPQMKNIVCLAKRMAVSSCTILIRGESGTGKELFARAIHNASDRYHKAFVPVNCAALPEALLESELFGYEDGAFSGARKGGKKGLFEVASEGTLFLDEIGELSMMLQGKLLRVIQEKTIRRVGGEKDIPVDVRILAATNRNLEKMIKKNIFRHDLYYRINVLPLSIPSLRERPEDIHLYINYYLQQYSQSLNKDLRLREDAEYYMLSHSWLGNVRELQNVLLRAAHLVNGDVIKKNDIVFDRLDEECNIVNENTKGNILKQTVNNVEYAVLKAELENLGSARAVAKSLGISHTAVLNKIHRYELQHMIKTSSI
jgi:transcriptional regulator of aroF, aroG, tyrA and aromatic amino acid transport